MEDFLGGLQYLRGNNRFKPLRRALKGYDFDSDGHLNRQDFLRLLRAKYEIQSLVTMDMIDAQESQHNDARERKLRTNLPISAIFDSEDGIPAGQRRPLSGKLMDVHGDMQIVDGRGSTLEDGESSEPNEIRGPAARPHVRLQSQLSRFGGMFDGAEDASSISSDKEESAVKHEQPSRKPESGIPLSFTEEAVWELVEAGFNELLDPIFLMRENEDKRAISSRAARYQRHLNCNGHITTNHISETEDILSVPEMVPTDPETLERREADIINHSLEELLAATGYGIVGDEGKRKQEPEPSSDPTLPQNRQPDLDMASVIRDNKIDQALVSRGGPGRLSFEEVEEIVDGDPELRGLVTSWLEWASF